MSVPVRPANRKRLYYLSCYLFLIPSGLLFLGMILLPVLFSMGLSFFDWRGLKFEPGQFHFIGLANYHKLFLGEESGRFWYYLYNTCFLMLSVPLSIAIHLAVALVMNRKLKEILVYRSVWFIPSVAGGVAMLLLWQWVFQADGGLLNRAIEFVSGAKGPDWLGTVAWAKPALITMGLWNGAGGMGMIMYLAALQGVPPSLYEAATVDGAGPWHRFWHITWPLVSPTTFFMLITGVIGGFQAGFMNAFVLTGGGPAGSTTTISYYIYEQAYQSLNLGLASAIAWILFVFVGALTFINWKVAGSKVHY